MKPLRPQLSGLIFKLALFYVLLSLPSLVLVESAILIYEFQRFMGGVEGGSLDRVTRSAADDLAASWPSSTRDEHRSLATWTESWVLHLQRPRSGLVADESFVLMELAPDPLAAAVLDPAGNLLASAPDDADWKADLPAAQSPDFVAALSATSPIALASEESPYKIRRLLAPIRSSDGVLHGLLFVELRLPVPWRKFLLDLSLEWPIVFGYLIVFGLASSFFLATWVTRRLNRVASAATARSSGDFSHSINDTSSDELGRLSNLLDRMALELQALIRSKAQLATLSERQRLARDLHDTVKQKAFALNLQLATARRQLGDHPSLERVVQAERLSQMIQQELAQILDELRASDAALPFTERLRQRVLEWAQTSGMEAKLAIGDVPSMPAIHEESLLRIADEALSNVLRHSGARKAEVTLRREADRVSLGITDNGSGIADDADAGMGLANMRERAAGLPSGRFEVTSDARDGTRIHVSFNVVDMPPV